MARAPHEGSLVPGKWRAACCWIRSLLKSLLWFLLDQVSLYKILISFALLGTLNLAPFQDIFDSCKVESRLPLDQVSVFDILLANRSVLFAVS